MLPLNVFEMRQVDEILSRGSGLGKSTLLKLLRG
jgi:hypothetical protein